MIWVWFAVVVALAYPFLLESLRKPMDSAARQAAPGRFANLIRGKTHFRWAGPENGQVVICIHGLTTPSFVWEGMVEGLVEKGYRVLTYDHYGRGFSDRPMDAQDRDFFVQHLAELMAHEQLSEPVTLMGYSMGGSIAAAFAATYPHKVNRVILLAPTGMIMNMTLVQQFALMPLIGDWAMNAFFANHFRAKTDSERLLRKSVKQLVDRQQNELNYRGFIPSITASLRGILSEPGVADYYALGGELFPVIAFWGGRDRTVPLAAKELLAEWNPNIKHVVVPEAGHGLPYTHTLDVLEAI